jgi:hypothetical protein
MAKEVPNHIDKIGNEIHLNDCVVFPSSNSLVVGKVVKINPKMLGVEEVSNNRWSYKGNKYPQDCVVINSADVTMYMLRNSSGSN